MRCGMFDYRLALMTGVDIPIPELGVALHQPSIKEISMMGEQDFFIGIQLLCINSSMYEAQLGQKLSNFELFIAILNDAETAQDKKNCVIQVLTLLLPEYQVILMPRSIILNSANENLIIDEQNFGLLQTVLEEQFCLKGSGQESFKPKSKKAQEIANKLMQARQRVAQQKATENSGSVFSQYLSILSIGVPGMGLKEAMELTMFQIYDLMERYSLYINWDIDIRSRMAGAKGDKPIDNWMKKIH